jgi:hypothetical protein
MARNVLHRLPLSRMAVLLLLLLLVSTSGSAYTIVMRDGRRLEIPDTFTVGKRTLTYEVGANIQMTLQLAAIDIPATERANKEPSGSLIRHAPKVETKVNTGALRNVARAQVSITNQDLEPFRQTRIESDLNYERRRKELGLPSIEESRRAAVVAGQRAEEELLSIKSHEQELETYWRSRATALRSEIAAANARIGSVQERLNELPVSYSFGTFSNVSPFASIDQLSIHPSLQSQVVTTQLVGQPRLGARIGFGNNRPRGQVFVGSTPFRGFRGRQAVTPFPFGAVVSVPYQSYDSSVERLTLLTQLDELFGYRAGLQARWRDLEDEARRAGAYPGWLR